MGRDISAREIELKSRLRKVRALIDGFRSLIEILCNEERDIQALIRRERNNRLLDDMLSDNLDK